MHGARPEGIEALPRLHQHGLGWSLQGAVPRRWLLESTQLQELGGDQARLGCWQHEQVVPEALGRRERQETLGSDGTHRAQASCGGGERRWRCSCNKGTPLPTSGEERVHNPSRGVCVSGAAREGRERRGEAATVAALFARVFVRPRRGTAPAPLTRPGLKAVICAHRSSPPAPVPPAEAARMSKNKGLKEQVKQHPWTAQLAGSRGPGPHRQPPLPVAGPEYAR